MSYVPDHIPLVFRQRVAETEKGKVNFGKDADIFYSYYRVSIAFSGHFGMEGDAGRTPTEDPRFGHPPRQKIKISEPEKYHSIETDHRATTRKNIHCMAINSLRTYFAGAWVKLVEDCIVVMVANSLNLLFALDGIIAEESTFIYQLLVARKNLHVHAS